MSRIVLNVARLVVAAAAIVAISYQFATLRSEVPTFSPANFFSFFTIQTNLFAIAMLGLVVIVRPPERSVAVRRGPRGSDALHHDHRRRVRGAPRRAPGEPRHPHRVGRLHRPQADAGRARRRLADRPAAAPAVVPDRAGLAPLSPRVPGLHADPRRPGRLVSVPVPRRFAARLRRGVAQLRGDAGRVRRCRCGVRGGREPAGCPTPGSAWRRSSEQEPHLDRVPELAALAPDTA